MVRILLITDPGCEAACAQEVTRIIGRSPTHRTVVVELEGSWDDAATLAYRIQSATRVLVALTAHATTLEDLTATPPDAQILAAALPPGGTFKAQAEYDSAAVLPQEIVESIGGWVHRTGIPVDLTRPSIVIVGVATPDGFDAGIDLVGAPLSKRDWRVMLSNRSIKSTIAASAALYADLRPEHRVLDPFGDDGSIAIETALLLGGVSPRSHERDLALLKFPALHGWTGRKRTIDAQAAAADVTAFGDTTRDVKAMRMNAKLAGVDLRITKVSVDWMDAKLEEGSIDRIITAPIPSGKVISAQRAAKLADQLFYQAAFVLAKGGTMTCLTQKPAELAQAARTHKMEPIGQRAVRMGKRPLEIITYRRKGKG